MNPQEANKLPPVGVAPSIAVLSALEGTQAYRFLVNPERVQRRSQANYSELPALYTAQPLLNYQHSASTLTLPSVKLWTPANDRDLSGPIQQLEAWTRPTAGKAPPPLQFVWGQLTVERCYLGALELEVTQWRSGAPAQAQGAITLLYAPQTPAPEVEAVPELSARERQQYADVLAEQYPDSETAITEDGRVTVDGEDFGSLRELLGDRVRPGIG